MGSYLLDYVKIFEGKKSSERREALTRLLNSEGHTYLTEEYEILGRKGVNIVVPFGEGSRDILVTAHYDCVRNSPGANDNASSVSVLLDLARRLRTYKVNNKIKIIFFGDEEPEKLTWLVGSTAYVKAHGIDNLIGVYNLELSGCGNMVAIWPVTKEVADEPVLNNLRQTLTQKGYAYGEAGKLPFFNSDHAPFRRAGFKGAFTLSLIPSQDEEAIRKFAQGHVSKLNIMFGAWLKKIGREPKLPLLFQRYHSPEDKSLYLEERALQLMADVIYSAVTNLDNKNKPIL